MRASIPTSRRVASLVVDPGERSGSLRRTSSRAAASSSAGSISSSASRAVSSSMPLRRSSWASARRARPLPPAGRLALAHPGPGEGARRRPARPPRTGRAAGWRSRPGRPWRPACRCSSLRRAGPAGQLVEQDLAGDRLGVGLGAERLRVLGGAEPGLDALPDRPADRPPPTASRGQATRPASGRPWEVRTRTGGCRRRSEVDPGRLQRSTRLLVDDLRADAELLEDLLLELVGQV